jgi:ParB-like chromosome segregation protein Spo0J
MSTQKALSTSVSDAQEIAMTDIVISKDNVRHSDPEKDLDELAASIKRLGLLQPVVLRGTYGGKTPYQLIGGQRRYL